MGNFMRAYKVRCTFYSVEGSAHTATPLPFFYRCTGKQQVKEFVGLPSTLYYNKSGSS